MSIKTAEIRFLVRVAGLPAKAVSIFRSDACQQQLEHIQAAEIQHLQQRAQLTANLESIIRGAPENTRHFWLAIKRDCYNGRSLEKYTAHALWNETPQEIVSNLAEVQTADRELSDAIAGLDSLYESERLREKRGLLGYLADQRFLRGVALSSRTLPEYLPRLLKKDPAAYDRRENRLISSMIMYLTRAALKCSPFSTLTCVGLGKLSDTPKDSASPQLVLADSWHERSRVRLQRFRVDQLVAIFALHPCFRDHLQVTLNPTLDSFGEASQFRYLKGPAWDINPHTGLLREGPYSTVSVRLRGPFIRWLLTHLNGQAIPYRELPQAYLKGSNRPAEDDLKATLDKLLDIGFLEFRRLWQSADPHPEKRLLEALVHIPKDPWVSRLISDLEEIVNGEEIYCKTDDSYSMANRIRLRIQEAISHAAPLGGYDQGVARHAATRSLHEDVFLESQGPQKEIVTLSTKQYKEITGNLQVFASLSNIFASHSEFLHSATVFALGRWPEENSVSFYEFFAAINPLFTEFSVHTRKSLSLPPLDAVVYNPFGLERLHRLQEIRRQLILKLPRCLDDLGDEALLDREAFDYLISGLPIVFDRSRDFCALVQPLNDHGTSWVLNMMAEGKGRLSSRFTSTMEVDQRNSFLETFTKTSQWKQQGQEVELVDIYCSAGHSANIHAPITQRVLELPGESPGLPPERLLRLQDLRVSWDSPENQLICTDITGRRILPAHLGSVVTREMPRIVQLLSLFGPEGFYLRRPTLPVSNIDGNTIIKRHRVGNVIYRRRTWLVQTAPVAEALRGLKEAAAYRRLDKWRRSLEIPEQVYVTELPNIDPSDPKKRPAHGPRKPIFVDFTSPHLAEIFCTLLNTPGERIQIAEALPSPDQQFLGGAGTRRAIEVHLESIY